MDKVLLPAIPPKRYFTIGEVADLCALKAHVLRYWEQEFTQLKPTKRRGNRRYYQHHEVLMVRRIRELLYDQGFTIAGARNHMNAQLSASEPALANESAHTIERDRDRPQGSLEWLRQELLAIQGILTAPH